MKKQLHEEIEKLNREYFGTSSILPDDKNPSQLARYNSAVIVFWNGQKNAMFDYLSERGWAVKNRCDTDGFGSNIIGEKDTMRITFTREYQNAFGTLYYLTSEKNVGKGGYERRTYQLDVQSNFMLNPHYEPVVPDGRYPYKIVGVEPSDKDELSAWVDDIAKVVEHNRRVGKDYNFRVTAGLWDGTGYAPTDVKYENLVEIIKVETGEN